MLLWNFRHALKFSFCFWLRWLKKNCLQCRRPRSDPWVRKTPWRRKRHPAPVPLPGEFHGQRSLVGYSLWDCKESETTDWQTHFTWGKQLPWGELGAILLKGEDTWRERHWRTRQNESREMGEASRIFQPCWWVSWMLLLERRSQCHMKVSSYWAQPKFLTQRDMNGNKWLRTSLWSNG